MQTDHLIALDARLVAAAKSIKVLSNLAWPVEAYHQFIKGWQAGCPQIPGIEYPRIDYSRNKDALLAVMADCPRDHPLGDYIFKTAESFFTAATMIENMGEPTFTELSGQIYGLPDDAIGADDITNLDAAKYFIDFTNEFIKSCPVSEHDYCVMPEHVAAEMRKNAKKFFTKHKIKVMVDPLLSSKAAAGATKVRIRGGTCFSPNDLPQLLQHEMFVHTTTMLNGREQPNFKSFGLGAPRTTMTQEGLALFAEFITTAMDLSRLQRIAMRVEAIKLALEGADFIDIFKFFHKVGQSEHESYQSAMRVFRGGNPAGRIVFTKDAVYLRGLIFIQTFLRKAIQSGKINFPKYLFSGRLALSDVLTLEAEFESGFIAAPVYLPAWVTDRSCLTAYLAYSGFTNKIRLGSISLDDFVRRGL